MRVMVVGTLPDAAERTAKELSAAGHEVLRCHETTEAPFPCSAFVEGRGCPLELGPIDVAVTVRDRPWPWPSPYEDGATCALRQHVPLVVVDAGVDPFRAWTTRGITADEDVAEACASAARAPLARHGEVATAAAAAVVARAGLDATEVTACVRREHGALSVLVHAPSAALDQTGTIAARVVTALRELDQYASGVNVSVVAP